jgi:rubrerythrin
VSLLKSPPAGTVRSLEELLAIAQALEQEAAGRYAALAARARAEGLPALAQLFERLAEEERLHERSIDDLGRRELGRLPDAGAVKWALPQVFEDETAGELAVSRTASAYQILSMAVRNEERAFTFWSYVAAEAVVPQVRAAAERMAHEELRHVAVLRRARRQAFHAERRHRLPEAAKSVGDRLSEAAVLERRLARELQDVAPMLEGDDRRRAFELSTEARALATELDPRATTDEPTGLPDPTATAERLVDDYLSAVDLTADEAVALKAQALAGRAISRLSWLRATVPATLGKRTSS